MGTSTINPPLDVKPVELKQGDFDTLFAELSARAKVARMAAADDVAKAINRTLQGVAAVLEQAADSLTSPEAQAALRGAAIGIRKSASDHLS